MSKPRVKITQRYRPDSEVSRWIWDEIKQLEDNYDELKNVDLHSAHERIKDLDVYIGDLKAKLAMAVEALKEISYSNMTSFGDDGLLDGQRIAGETLEKIKGGNDSEVHCGSAMKELIELETAVDAHLSQFPVDQWSRDLDEALQRAQNFINQSQHHCDTTEGK